MQSHEVQNLLGAGCWMQRLHEMARPREVYDLEVFDIAPHRFELVAGRDLPTGRVEA